MSQTEKDLPLCSCYDLFTNYIDQVNDLVNDLSLDSDQKLDLKSKIQLLKQISIIQSVSEPSMDEESRLLIAILKSTNEVVFNKLIDEISFIPQSILEKSEREMFAWILTKEAELLASKNLNEILQKLFLERSDNVVLEKKPDPPKQVSKPKEVAEIEIDDENFIPQKVRKNSSEVVYVSATKKYTSTKKTSKPYLSISDRLRSLIEKKKSFCICDPHFLQGTTDLPRNIKRVKCNASIETLMEIIENQIRFIEKKPDILVSENVNLIKIIFDKRVYQLKKKEATLYQKEKIA